MEKTKRKNRVRKVYKPEGSQFWGLVFGLVFLVFHFFVMTSFWNESSAWFITLFLMPVYTFWIWSTIIEATQTRITFYDDGLELQRGGSRLFSTWENMRHIGAKSRSRNSTYGIFLSNEVQPDNVGLIEGLVYGHSSDYIELSSIIKVPTKNSWTNRKIDLDKFAQTEFGQDLMRYTPHLFEKGKKVKTKHRLSDDEIIEADDLAWYEEQLNRDLDQM